MNDKAGTTSAGPPSGSKIDRVSIDGLRLSFYADDNGGRHYRQRSHVEEAVSPFYSLLAGCLQPTHCIDIGANYGFTGMLMRRQFPHCELILVEPVPWINAMISRNFSNNALPPAKVIGALVGAQTEPDRTFGINVKGGSQDNRVLPVGEDWEIINTPSITIDDLVSSFPANSRVYIKIDTQGYETFVFEGARQFLSASDQWIIKTEFAPKWMESQGSDPEDFLFDLVGRYLVFEQPERFQWNSTSLFDGLGGHLEEADVGHFVEYVRSLNANGNGWVDLLVMPKKRLTLSRKYLRPLRKKMAGMLR